MEPIEDPNHFVQSDAVEVRRVTNRGKGGRAVRGYVALSLGYGSIYNHSDEPNAAYDMDMPDVMLFYALRDIRAGEEILISYAGEAGKKKELGFEATTAPPQAVGTDESGSPVTGPSGENAA